jgi:hypothetical protein
MTIYQKVEPLNHQSKSVQKKEKSMIDISTMPPEAREIMNQLPRELMEKMMQQYGN